MKHPLFPEATLGTFGSNVQRFQLLVFVLVLLNIYILNII